MMPETITYQGGCHCGAVAFEVQAPASIDASRCNCSICSMTGFLHLIVTKDAFSLLRGEDDLETYRFNTGTAQHKFCKVCGVKSFYVPRSHPDGISVNVTCLDPSTINAMTITDFDGQNWEDSIGELDSPR
jgi:hypothetical protein